MMSLRRNCCYSFWNAPSTECSTFQCRDLFDVTAVLWKTLIPEHPSCLFCVNMLNFSYLSGHILYPVTSGVYHKALPDHFA